MFLLVCAKCKTRYTCGIFGLIVVYVKMGIVRFLLQMSKKKVHVDKMATLNNERCFVSHEQSIMEINICDRNRSYRLMNISSKTWMLQNDHFIQIKKYNILFKTNYRLGSLQRMADEIFSTRVITQQSRFDQS